MDWRKFSIIFGLLALAGCERQAAPPGESPIEKAAPASAEGDRAESALPLVGGNAAYYIPTTMVESQSSPVDLWIDARLPVEELRAKLHRFLLDNATRTGERSGRPADQTVKVRDIAGRDVVIGARMYAELRGQDFIIEPAGLQEQRYIEGRSLCWSWLVKPQRASSEGLPLEIHVYADPGQGRTAVPTIREVVFVDARKRTWRERAEEIDWWIKLFGGGGIGAALIWIGTRVLQRRP